MIAVRCRSPGAWGSLIQTARLQAWDAVCDGWSDCTLPTTVPRGAGPRLVL